MTAEAPKKTKAPTAVEIYRIAAFTAALLFTWTSRSAYDPPALAQAFLVLVAVAALARKTTLAPVVFLSAFFLMEAFSGRQRSTPTQFVIVGSMLGIVIFNARVLASLEAVRSVVPPRRSFWGSLSTPLRILLGREKKPDSLSGPGEMDEAVRLLLTMVAAVVGGWLVLRNAPYDAFSRVRMGLPREVVTLSAILLPFAVCVMLARTAFWFVDPRRKDAKLAEMELNELVWTELRPEMTRVGAFLGTAAAKEPRLSEPKQDG
jgi:hypothetical protein